MAGVTAPTISFACAPVLELADRRDLQSRAHSGRPGPIPGWGIQFLIPLPGAVLYYYMPKKTKMKRKKSKPGPQEERLIIPGNPQDAIDRLLKKKPK